MNSKSHDLSDLTQTGQCNFYDVEENESCYKKAVVREDANYRILCDKHYETYRKILQTQDKQGYWDMQKSLETQSLDSIFEDLFPEYDESLKQNEKKHKPMKGNYRR